jgi:hypothetical protein
VRFRQVAKPADGGLVRRRRPLHARKPPQHRRIVQRLFGDRIAQVELLLQKVNPQYDAEVNRRKFVLSLRIVRPHQRF